MSTKKKYAVIVIQEDTNMGLMSLLKALAEQIYRDNAESESEVHFYRKREGMAPAGLVQEIRDRIEDADASQEDGFYNLPPREATILGASPETEAPIGEKRDGGNFQDKETNNK